MASLRAHSVLNTVLFQMEVFQNRDCEVTPTFFYLYNLLYNLLDQLQLNL